MTRVFVVGAIGLAACTGAYAGIVTYLDCYYQPDVTPGFDSGAPEFNDGTYYTVDLCVELTDGDDWTSTEATATLDGGEFFNHPYNDETPPADTWDLWRWPALEFDSFYCSTEPDPNNIPPYADPWLPVEHHAAQHRYAVWFGTTNSGGAGPFLHARYTIRAFPEDLPVTFRVQGDSTTRHGGGMEYPFELTCVIPEPASLLALLLVLPLIRRR